MKPSGGLAVLVMCVGGGALFYGYGSDGMFSLFRKKGAAAETIVHPDVGAPLVPQTRVPPTQPARVPECTPVQVALKGKPPDAVLLDEAVPGETTTGHVSEATAGHPRLGFFNVRDHDGDLHIEIWELGAGDRPVFERRRTVSLDARQSSWVMFSLSGIACLPDNRFLLAVAYHDPYVRHALFMYDNASDSSTKLANVKPYADNRQQHFDAQRVAPDAVIAHYFTDTIRLAPDVYYNTPSHLRLFTPRHPQGIELLQLAAAGGSVRSWAVIDRTLWIDALDYREKHQPKELLWSLSLDNILPR